MANLSHKDEIRAFDGTILLEIVNYFLLTLVKIFEFFSSIYNQLQCVQY